MLRAKRPTGEVKGMAIFTQMAPASRMARAAREGRILLVFMLSVGGFSGVGLRTSV
jgi:hypothetical protein